MSKPKRRWSKSRQAKRRITCRISKPNLPPCSNCGRPKRTHRVCPYCGYYKGRQVVQIKEKKKHKR